MTGNVLFSACTCTAYSYYRAEFLLLRLGFDSSLIFNTYIDAHLVVYLIQRKINCKCAEKEYINRCLCLFLKYSKFYAQLSIWKFDVISVLNPRISKQLAMHLHCLKAISFLQRYKCSVYGTCFMEITTCISKSKSSLCFY